jgi:excisionase family DNA binding protein
MRPWAAAHATGDLYKKTRRRKRGSDVESNDADVHQLTVAQVAEICQVHPKTVRNWVNWKKLKAARLDRLIRIDLEELKKFLQENSS